MLEQKGVAHLTKLWQTPPSPEIASEAQKITSQFTKDKSIALLCAGLSGVAVNTGYEYYRQLSTALFTLGLQKGLQIESLMPWHVPPEGPENYIFTVEEAKIISSGLKQRGLKVGFVHGHYRILTPANWANVALAAEQCDMLLLGIEDGWRTKQFKNAEPVFRDWQRHQWVQASGFDGGLVRISRTDYSDKGYKRILSKIKPNIYFGNLSIPQEKQKEMEERAAACGATYIALPKQEGFSTSDFLGKNVH